MERIFLDACALCRLFDNRVQLRVRMEAQAIQAFFQFLLVGSLAWIGSEVLEAELLNSPNSQLRKRALELASLASERVIVSDASFVRADQLERAGYGALDALHLAAAEQGRVDTLLTTDDRFLRQAHRGLGNPARKVRNPVDWVKGFLP